MRTAVTEASTVIRMYMVAQLFACLELEVQFTRMMVSNLQIEEGFTEAELPIGRHSLSCRRLLALLPAQLTFR